MRERTERKARARRVLKNHYWLLLTVCLIGVVFGAEFSKGQIVSYETPVQNIVTVENSASLLRGVGESPVFGRQKGVFAMVGEFAYFGRASTSCGWGSAAFSVPRAWPRTL